MKKEFRNVIIRNITSEQLEDIQLAMRDTGNATASQALLSVCKGYNRLSVLLKNIQEENKRLRKENELLRNCALSVIDTGNMISSVLSQNKLKITI